MLLSLHKITNNMTQDYLQGFLDSALIDFEEVESKITETHGFKFWFEIDAQKEAVKISYSFNESYDPAIEEHETDSSWILLSTKKPAKIFWEFWAIMEQVSKVEIKDLAEERAIEAKYKEDKAVDDYLADSEDY